MKLQAKFIQYEGRIIFGWASLLPLLLLPAFAGLQWLAWHTRVTPPLPLELIRSFELLLPLASALATAHLMVVEREERFAELRNSYPYPAWALPTLRTAGALLLGLLAWGTGAATFRWAYGPYALGEVTLPALAPTLLLLGVSLLASNLTGSYWVGMGAAVGYWLEQLLAHAQKTGPLYLFERTWSNPQVDYGLNRWLLATLGLALIVLNGWISARRRS